jgi:hypothetical protein
LRAAPLPLTAAALAEWLEVTARTIYLDIAAAQASQRLGSDQRAMHLPLGQLLVKACREELATSP